MYPIQRYYKNITAYHNHGLSMQYIAIGFPNSFDGSSFTRKTHKCLALHPAELHQSNIKPAWKHALHV